MALNREQIMNGAMLKTRAVHVPDLEGDIIVRQVTALDMETILEKTTDADGKVSQKGFRSLFLVMSIVDDDNNRLFSDSEAHLLSNFSNKLVDQLFTAAKELSGIRDGEEEAIDEIKKSSLPQTGSVPSTD